MASVRDFLNPLGRNALVRLCHLRNLRRASTNDDRKRLLAHSYHGNLNALIDDMYRYELVASLESLVIPTNGTDFSLYRPSQYGHAKLQDLARQCILSHLGDEWRQISVDPNDFDFTNSDATEANSVDALDHADDRLEWIAILQGTEAVWSRPRKLSRLLLAAGIDGTKRLSTVRFRGLLEKLHQSGIHVSLGDEDVALYPESATTPGLQAKVRLRRVGGINIATLRQKSILSVRGKSLSTQILASQLISDSKRTELRIISAYYDCEWIRELIAKIGVKRITSVKLLYNGLGGRRLDDQRDDLRDLIRELGDRGCSVEARLAFAPGIFHSKLFMSSKVALLGSANATTAAFKVNEEILSLVEMDFATQYFNEVWKQAIDVTDDKLGERSAAKNLVGFFRAGSLFFKPQTSICYTYNPYTEWAKKLKPEDRQRLSGGFRHESAEPGQGIGAFSVALAVNLQEESENERRSIGRFGISRYAIETTLGYWVPDFYVDEVESRVKDLGLDRRKALEERGFRLKELGEEAILELYSAYRRSADRFIQDLDLQPPPEATGRQHPIVSIYRAVLMRLTSDDFLDRRCNQLVRSGMPEIWDDRVAANEFVESFFEYIALDASRPSRRLVPRQILERIGVSGIVVVDAHKLRIDLEKSLRMMPWRRDDWKETDHTDVATDSDEDD